MVQLSIVVPCENEEESMPLFLTEVEAVTATLTDLEVAYWFVDDGSSDGTLDLLRQWHEKSPKKIHYLSFSRHFGKEAALYAGLKAQAGDYTVVMDADLQDPPALLPQMLKLLQTGDYDCIGTRRLDRTGEKPIRSFLSHHFYGLLNQLSKTKIVPGVRDYRMMTRQMVKAVLSVTEYNRFSKGIFSWVGYKTKYLAYHNLPRVAGKSDWTTWQLLKYAVEGIADFSQAPLNLAVWMGTSSALLSLIGLIFVLIRRLITPNSSIFGWASLVCLILFLGGMQLLCMGILGKYIGRIYLQVKQRPLYLIKEKSE